MDFIDAVDVVNDATEHRYGSGPIEDGGPKRAIACRAAKQVAEHPSTPGITKALILEAIEILSEAPVPA